MSSTGPPPGLEEELRIGMPVLHAVRHDEGGAGEHAADHALVDQLPRQPPARAKERVGRASDHQAARLGLGDDLAPHVDVDRERLLGEDVLAGRERGERHGRMRRRHGKVHDDVDVVARKQRIDRHCLYAEFLPLRRGDLRAHVGAGRAPSSPARAAGW